MKPYKITLILILFLSGFFVDAQQLMTDHSLSSALQAAATSYLNKPDSAILLIDEALQIARSTHDQYAEGFSYYLYSKAYWVKANFRLSTEYGFKGLKIFENSEYVREHSLCLLSLARTFVELGNLQKAALFIHRARKQGQSIGATDLEAIAYREYSFLLAEQSLLDSALYYSDKGIALFKAIGDSLDISILYGRKSRIYYQKKDYHESLRFARMALGLDSMVRNQRALGIAYFQVAQNEWALNRSQAAISNVMQSIRINTQIGNLTWQVKANELLAAIYLQQKKSDLAAAVLQQVSFLKDELYNAEKAGQIQEMQALHELESKETTIQALENENRLKMQEVKLQHLFLIFLLVGIVLLVLLICVLARIRFLQHKTNKALESKNAAIEQQRVAIAAQAENLRQLDQLKTKLFSVISHDLRGPILNLQALLDLFTKRLMTAEEFVMLSEKLKSNLNMTQTTLENLLAWALSQMNGIKTEKRKIEITSSIEEACDLMEEMATRKNVYLFKPPKGEQLFVLADANQVQVILRNLIHNAIKFSALNDPVHILASREDNRCHITIRDTGIGMTNDEIDQLAGSNSHFSKEGTQQEKGTGIGLMLCKEFITRNGGDLKIKSAVGTGTEVSFTLMLAEN